MNVRRWAGVLMLLGATAALAESPRWITMELKLGSYLPQIDDGFTPPGPYAKTFANNPGGVLRFDMDFEKFVYQGWGSALIGVGFGYAEKFGKAHTAGSATADSSEAAGVRFIPLRLVAEYRFDTPALRWNVPLVPYVKAGLTAIPFSAVVGGATDVSSTSLSSGSVVRFGYLLAAGLMLQLDFLDERAVRDVDTDIGINHFYFFAEYDYEKVDSFGSPGLNLSSSRFAFGLALDY